MHHISDNITSVRSRIAAAAARAGRSPAEVTLVAVTKTHPPELVAEALAAGVLDLGENRVQEAAAKAATLAGASPAPRWHLIGHLQRNKAGLAAQIFDVVHSVDSLRLAEALSRQAAEHRSRAPGGPELPILLQVNVSGEASKEGFELAGGLANRAGLAALEAAVEQIGGLPGLRVAGLMTIAPLAEHPERARPTFRALRELRDALARRFPTLGWNQLSMGMTDDFEVAIEEGATIVRVGRAIFGAREPGA